MRKHTQAQWQNKTNAINTQNNELTHNNPQSSGGNNPAAIIYHVTRPSITFMIHCDRRGKSHIRNAIAIINHAWEMKRGKGWRRLSRVRAAKTKLLYGVRRHARRPASSDKILLLLSCVCVFIICGVFSAESV